MRRRKIGEELPTLRADITRLMALAYSGDMSAMSQMMAHNYFLAALDESKLELKIRESELKNLDDANNRALWLKMICQAARGRIKWIHMPGENKTSMRSRMM